MTSQQWQPPKIKPPRKRAHWIIAALLTVFALMIGSAIAGWWFANQTLAGSTSTLTENIATPEPVELSTEVVMPDVRGLSESEARQVLADRGYLAANITLVLEPSATQPGVVITQDPVFGTADVTAITLGIAVPATVPPAIGRTREDVVADLAALGVSTDILLQYSADKPAGTVLGISPETGAPLVDTATITVATTGDSVGLDAVRTTDNNCSSWSSVLLAGKAFNQSLTCETGDKPRNTTWVISTLADRFVATVGVDDTQPPGSSAVVEFLLDGVVIGSENVAYGAPLDVDLDVAGAIQLTIRVSGSSNIQVGLGNPLLFGSETNIETLVNR